MTLKIEKSVLNKFLLRGDEAPSPSNQNNGPYDATLLHHIVTMAQSPDPAVQMQAVQQVSILQVVNVT